MSETVTIKQLSQELGVSEQALRQWCKKNNIRKERTQGTKPCYIIGFDTEKQIRAYYSGESNNESNETKAESNERKEANQNNQSNESDETCQKLSNDLNLCQMELDKALKEIQSLKQINSDLTEKTSVIDSLTEKCKALESSCQVLETKLSEKENYINSLESDKASQSEQLSTLNTQLVNVITAANEERDKERQERQTILSRLWSEEDKTKRLETELSKYKSMVDSQQVTETEQAAPEPERQQSSSEPQKQPEQKRSFFKRLFGKK